MILFGSLFLFSSYVAAAEEMTIEELVVANYINYAKTEHTYICSVFVFSL